MSFALTRLFLPCSCLRDRLSDPPVSDRQAYVLYGAGHGSVLREGTHCRMEHEPQR